MPNKKWKKPKLIVLYRGDRHERVLVACKFAGLSGPNAVVAVCWFGFATCKLPCSRGDLFLGKIVREAKSEFLLEKAEDSYFGLTL